MKILVLGNTCSGKSTLIKSINKTLELPVVAIDDFRKVHGNFFWDGNRKAMDHFIKAIRTDNTDQIIEASGIGITGQRLKEHISRIDDEILLIIMTTNSFTCRERAYRKDWSQLKMPDAHPREIEFRIKQYNWMQITAQYFRLENLEIDGDQPLEIITKKVIDHVIKRR